MARRSPANMVDRISRLSDELLCHILSFLLTQQAVQTSLLSKRWRHLWTSVPTLYYNDQFYLKSGQRYSCFEKFVYATILARDAQQPITTFSLKMWASGSELSDAADDDSHDLLNAHVNVWVNTATRRGVENLDIEMWLDNYVMSSSCCIFTCITLVVLKLNGLALNASSSVELPLLKCLHLVNVEFVERKYLMELLYGCPMLEDLKIRSITYLEGYDVKEEFKFKSLPKLVTADLRYVWMGDTNILLKTICNVQFLDIEQFRVVDEVPEFPHLRHLGLTLYNRSWHSLLLMLKNFPKLQILKLELIGSVEPEDVLPYPHLVVPECLTSHLTECYLKYFLGTESDLQFAKYILQNSTSLDSMKVHCVSPNPLEVIKKLAFYSRKSASCELSFI